jgi:signal transduction histidine kinase
MLRFFRTATARMVLLNLGLAFITTAVLAGFIYWSTIAVIEDEVRDTVAAEIGGLIDQFANSGLPGLIAVINERTASDTNPDAVYLLADRFGHPIAGNLTEWPPQIKADGRWQTLDLLHYNADVLVGAVAYTLSPAYVLLVGRDMRARVEFRERVVRSLIGAAGIAIILSLAVGYLLSRYMLRNVETIAATSRQIVAGDLTKRVPVRGTDDEFDRLARSLNEMLARIEELMTGMRVVSDSVAHDLRSPLTRLKARLELALARPEDTLEHGEALEIALEETDGLLKMLSSLLEIARTEAGLDREHMAEIDLGDMIDNLAELYEPAAEEKGLSMHVQTDLGAVVTGHRELLAQAASNLIENAIKFTEQSGRIDIVVSKQNGDTKLIIRDQGPGIPEGDRDAVLQRFVRLDSARSTRGTGPARGDWSSDSAVSAWATGRKIRNVAPRPGPGLWALIEAFMADSASRHQCRPKPPGRSDRVE